MKTFRILGFAVLLSFSLCWSLSPANAGVVGNVSIRMTEKNKLTSVAKGKYRATENWTKVDTEQTMQDRKISRKEDYIIDQDQDKGTIVLHPNQKFLNVDFNLGRQWERQHWLKAFRAGAIRVNPHMFEKLGYETKLLREQKIGKELCNVWSIQNFKTNRFEMKALVWEAKAPKWNKAPLKVKIELEKGFATEMTLTKLKVAEVDVASLVPPKGYTAYEPKIMVNDAALKQYAPKGNNSQSNATHPR